MAAETQSGRAFLKARPACEHGFGIAVVGAGPAGLMAAEVLAGAGVAVTVYDRMPSVGRKFLLAGRGGLNLTHSEPFGRFVSRYGDLPPPMLRALEGFGPDRLREWAAGLGEDTLIGSSGRVFPRSWKASPLLRAWLGRLDEFGVRFALRHRWSGWGGAGALRFEAPAGPVEVPEPDATVLALGGASWPRLGSDGGWAATLARDGVPVRPLRPANASILIGWSDQFRARMAGTPLKRIALACGGRRWRGEAVVTEAGLEGGVVYAAFAALRDELERTGEARLAVDLRPDLSEDALAARLAAPRGKQSVATFLRKVAGVPPVATALLREPARDLPTEPARLAALIKRVPLRVVGTGGLDRAISTAGGISWPGLDDDFMLRARPGVFAAGEMLDWEAPTGGYLLQGCFATGAAAAHGALAWLEGGGARAPAPSQRL